MKDKTSRVFELISTSIIALYCAVMIYYAQTHPITTKVSGMGAYAFPVAAYWIMLACCTIIIVKNIVTGIKQKKLYNSLSEGEKEDLPEKEKNEFHYILTDKRVWITIAAIVIYAALWKITGFMVATLLFCAVEVKIIKRDVPIWKCLLVGLAADVVVYLVFFMIFKIRLPETFLKKIIY